VVAVPGGDRGPLRTLRRARRPLPGRARPVPGELRGPVPVDGLPLRDLRRHRRPEARSFADTDLVRSEQAGRTRRGAGADVRFVAADYRHPLDVPDHSVDLLISLFTGPMGESARRYLRDGGWLLANTSHGDAALAALDRSLRLAAVVHHRGGRCRVSSDGLDDYLVPSDRRRPMPPGSAPRGAASPTKGAFAYLFQRA